MNFKMRISVIVTLVLTGIGLGFGFSNCSPTTPAGSSLNASYGLINATSAYSVLGVGMSDVITINGGVPPYTLKITSGPGSVSPATYGSTGTYLAPPTGSGSVQISIVDSSGNAGMLGFSLSGNSTSVLNTANTALMISPQNPSVALNGSVTFNVTGGSGSYVYSVLTPGGGSFNGSTFTAGSTNITVTISVIDSLGNNVQTSVLVGAGSGTTSLSDYPANVNVSCTTTYSPSCGTGTNIYYFQTDSQGNPSVRIARTGYGAFDTGYVSGTTTYYQAENGACSFLSQITASPTVIGGYYQGSGADGGDMQSGTCIVSP